MSIFLSSFRAKKCSHTGSNTLPVCITALAAALTVNIPNAAAFEFGSGDFKGHFDSTLSYGTAWRVEKPDPALTANVNGNNGDLNYHKGLISNTVKGTHDLDMDYKNYGAFFRGTYFYDAKNNNKDELTPQARAIIGRHTQILDAYVRADYTPGDHNLNLRLGNQVVNWGESLFYQNGLSAANAADLNRLRVPGSEVREALIPSPMAWSSLQLTSHLNLEALYIFRFKRIKLDACGSYFSTTNTFCDGGPQPLIVGPTPIGTVKLQRAPDVNAKDGGEYGAALRYVASSLNDTEFGLYYMNYHMRAPIISARAPATPAPLSIPTVFVEYPEDITLVGTSFNTDLRLWGLGLQGEYSYRHNMPFQANINGLLNTALGRTLTATSKPNEVYDGAVRLDVSQFSLGMSKDFSSRNPFAADDMQVLVEAVASQVHLPPPSQVRLQPNAGSADPDAFSWGYQLRGFVDYFNVIGPVALRPSLAFSHDVNGTSPSGGNFVEGRKATTWGLTATYLSAWSADLAYTHFFGAGSRDTRSDRDFVAANIKYTF